MEKTKTYVTKDECLNRKDTYITHDNGSRPFKVVANKDGITIYTFEECDIKNIRKK